MAYVKNIWVDQDVERPKTYEVTNNQDGSITLTDSFGLVTELGTPVNEVNMNHIEDGIDGCAIRKHNLTETFNLGEWVLGGTGDNEWIYKSLIANNVGNAITDTTKWGKVTTDLSGKADVDGSNMIASVKNFDGQWVNSNATLANNVSISTTEVSYSLATYLPNDEYNYEVLFDCYVETSATTNKYINIYIKTDLIQNFTGVCGAKTTANSTAFTTGSTILAVGSGRSVTVNGLTSTNAVGTYILQVNAYRRIGTNS